ncbi:MAG: hypothetical protein KatS3mg014_0828 [Actinomycetota bacterium]|nr:MAG: hypothetical protein KatS3mg014_0828 [Actinomycetota bacterium]
MSQFLSAKDNRHSSILTNPTMARFSSTARTSCSPCWWLWRAVKKRAYGNSDRQAAKFLVHYGRFQEPARHPRPGFRGVRSPRRRGLGLFRTGPPPSPHLPERSTRCSKVALRAYRNNAIVDGHHLAIKPLSPAFRCRLSRCKCRVRQLREGVERLSKSTGNVREGPEEHRRESEAVVSPHGDATKRIRGSIGHGIVPPTGNVLTEAPVPYGRVAAIRFPPKTSGGTQRPSSGRPRIRDGRHRIGEESPHLKRRCTG